MGCQNTKIVTYRDAVLTFTTEKDKNTYKTLRPYLELDNFNNVNKVYNFMMEIDQDKTLGKGIF